MALDPIQLELLKQVADIHEVPQGAYSLRINGALHGKNSSENITIEKKTDKPGIDIYIKAGTKKRAYTSPFCSPKPAFPSWSTTISTSAKAQT